MPFSLPALNPDEVKSDSVGYAKHERERAQQQRPAVKSSRNKGRDEGQSEARGNDQTRAGQDDQEDDSIRPARSERVQGPLPEECKDKERERQEAARPTLSPLQPSVFQGLRGPGQRLPFKEGGQQLEVRAFNNGGCCRRA